MCVRVGQVRADVRRVVWGCLCLDLLRGEHLHFPTSVCIELVKSREHLVEGENSSQLRALMGKMGGWGEQ